MPSKLDAIAIDDFRRSYAEVKQTVIRRIGGDPAQTEPVVAVVELEGGQVMTSGADGQFIDVAGVLEVAADQATTFRDTWVIDGAVYHQLGEPVSSDGATKSIQLTKRTSVTAKEPRVRK